MGCSQVVRQRLLVPPFVGSNPTAPKLPFLSTASFSRTSNGRTGTKVNIMSRPTLNASLRTATGKGAARKLRSQGLVPAVIYGGGKPATNVTVHPKALVGILNGPKGRFQAIELQVEGESEARLALVKDFSLHPFKRTLKHVDFQQVTEQQRVTMKVPLVRQGIAPLEKAGGKVRFTHKVIKISCEVANLPAQIDFDLGEVTEAAKIRPPRVSDIPMPNGVTAVYKDDYSFIQVKLPKGGGDADAEEAEG